MRVAMFTSWGGRCGIASYTADLVAALRELDVEVDIVEVPYLDRDPTTFHRRMERLHDADVVHLQHEYTFFGGIRPGSSSLASYTRPLGRPLVITPHTVFTARELLRVEQETRRRQRIAKELLSRIGRYRRSVEVEPFQSASALIVPTRRSREALIGRGFLPERVQVIPWGLPTASSLDETRKGEWATRLKPAGSRLVTIFGYVQPDKGYETALAALRRLPPAVRLAIAGGTRVPHESAYLDQLKSAIAGQGLDSRVTITGYLEPPDVAAVMALSDLVLVPHSSANGSYSLMVALAHERAILASDLPCFRETGEECGTPELFPPGDSAALAERLGFLMASAGARRRLERAAREARAVREWPVIARRTLEVYSNVREESRPRG